MFTRPLAGSVTEGIDPDWVTLITPPQTEHRARMPLAGTLLGSTRNTDRHSGQLTFIRSLRLRRAPMRAER
jgi:hypothetical protein